MAKIYPINERPYIELCRHAEREDRLGYAFDYIDDIIFLFVKYGMKGDGQALVDIVKQGFKGWKKLVRYEIVVETDDEGNEYLLDHQTYPDQLMNRFLETATTEKDYDHMVNTLSKIYYHFGYEFTQPPSWDEWVFSPDTPAPPGEADDQSQETKEKL
jgi:hypothetical protein